MSSLGTIYSLKAVPARARFNQRTGEKIKADKSRGMSSFMLERLAELEELRYWPHPFSCVSEMLEYFNLPDAKYKGWRLTEYHLGFINGCPEMRGRMMATNGIMCILRGESDALHFGHIENFVHLNNLPDVEYVPKEPRAKKVCSLLEGWE